MSKKRKYTAQKNLQLAIIHPHAAAIDVGSMLMVVSYTDAQGEHQMIQTDGFTESLDQLAQTLTDAGVTQVSMEATGVYWMALYELLEQQGLKVILVNPHHFKNVDGQKTDVHDSQWLHQLHAHGLLRASHIAPELYRELRSYVHERNLLQKQKTDILNRIQKILTKLNVKVQHLISDIEGKAGMTMIRQIANGISDPQQLLAGINISRLKASKEDLLKSLKGVYKPYNILILKNSLTHFDFLKQQMKNYELAIEEVLCKMLPDDNNKGKPKIKSKTSYVRKNQYSINLKEYLRHIVGVDLTQIDGLDEISILEIISVTGTDMSKWRTAEHFASWLNLSPRPKITGGKLIGHTKRFTKNNATQALRLGAQTLWKHKGKLGQRYRRLAAQKGSTKAIKALARTLAVIVYNMIKNKTEYDATRTEGDLEKQNGRRIVRLQKQAAQLGFTLQKVV